MSNSKKKGSCLGTIFKIVLILVIIGGIGIYVLGVTAGSIEDYGGVVQKITSMLPGNFGVSAEFKKTMDSYEEFIDEYIEFMEKYSQADNMTEMLDDYTEYMDKYAQFIKDIDAIDTEELSEADLAYYNLVTLRVSQKLLKVTASN